MSKAIEIKRMYCILNFQCVLDVWPSVIRNLSALWRAMLSAGPPLWSKLKLISAELKQITAYLCNFVQASGEPL